MAVHGVMLRLAVLLLAVAGALAVPKADPEFEKVTCGSAIKLTHLSTGFKLHSHEIPYGSGSGQQSVTGFPENQDPNSYFVVEGAYGTVCERGEPVRCGSQEVSCFGDLNGEGDTGDNWTVQCLGREKFWLRERQVRLLHKDTGKYLASSARFRYPHPIPGQQEVHGSGSADKDSVWAAQEGIYIGDKDYYTSDGDE